MFQMVGSRRVINISAANDRGFVRDFPKKKSKKKLFLLILFLLIFLPTFFLYNNLPLFRSITIGLNEMEIRYDTFSVSFTDLVPNDLKENIVDELSQIEYKGKKRFSFVEENGDVEIGVLNEGFTLYSDYLIPVGHFYWLENSVSNEDVSNREIVVNEGYGDLVEAVLEVEVKEREDALGYLEENEESSIGFVNFENLNHQYQVLLFNEKYFLDDVDGGVKFEIGIKVNSAPEFLTEVVLNNTEHLYPAVQDINDVVKINMSGVTAISRNLAFKIEASGNPAYPAEKIADFLGNADIVHTSNEVSFVPGCVPERSMRFCSHPSYIQTLEAINANVIELTGNHNNDYGAIYNTQSIEMYKERDWGYYGGGLNTEDASEALIKEVKDSKIAFLGYNYYDTIHNNHANLAGVSRAGANSFSFEKMERDIEKAKEEGAFVIVTFQFQECWSYPPSDVIYPPCYKPLSNPDQRNVFKTAIDYGADVVIGSQAHQPQTYEIYEGKPIFYGTGNIFFDQIYWIGTRQGMILTHYVYENKLLQSRITTTIYDDDMRPYVTEGEQRDLLLRLLRDARD